MEVTLWFRECPLLRAVERKGTSLDYLQWRLSYGKLESLFRYSRPAELGKGKTYRHPPEFCICVPNVRADINQHVLQVIPISRKDTLSRLAFVAAPIIVLRV